MLTVLFEFINVLKMHTETMHHKRITNIIIDQPEQLNNCHHKLFKIKTLFICRIFESELISSTPNVGNKDHIVNNLIH